VPDLGTALRNIHGSLKPGGPFVVIVPTPTWTSHLAIVETLDRIGLYGLARAHAEALDQLFRHVHLYDAPTWKRHLEDAGFDEVRVSGIAQRGVSWTFDALLLPSVIGYFNKKLAGRWIMFPRLRPLTADAVRNLIDTIGARIPDADDSAEYVLECRKKL
jgi:hypothetical protein